MLGNQTNMLLDEVREYCQQNNILNRTLGVKTNNQKLLDNGFGNTKEYTVASLWNKDQLSQLLAKDYLFFNDRLVVVSSDKITTSIIKQNGKYYHFDPNRKPAEKSNLSNEELATLIFSSHHFDQNLPSPIGLQFFSADEIKRQYPKPEDILRTTNPSPLKVGYSELAIAAKVGAIESVGYFVGIGVKINALVEQNQTALIIATKYHHQEIVKYLLEKGADPNLATSDGWTALMQAARYNDSETLDQLITDQRTDVNLKTEYGRTALMIAAQFGNLEAVSRLLAKSDPNLQDVDGFTALMVAIISGKVDVAKEILTNKSIEINAANNYGRNALFLAVILKRWTSILGGIFFTSFFTFLSPV